MPDELMVEITIRKGDLVIWHTVQPAFLKNRVHSLDFIEMVTSQTFGLQMPYIFTGFSYDPNIMVMEL